MPGSFEGSLSLPHTWIHSSSSHFASGEAEVPKTPQPEVLPSPTRGPASLVWPHRSQSAHCLSPPGNPNTALTTRKSLGMNGGLCLVGPPSAIWGHAGHTSPHFPQVTGTVRMTHGFERAAAAPGSPSQAADPGLYCHPPPLAGEVKLSPYHTHRTKKKVEAPKKLRNMPRAAHLESGRGRL